MIFHDLCVICILSLCIHYISIELIVFFENTSTIMIYNECLFTYSREINGVFISFE